MNRDFKLSISKPCSEKFSDFHPTEKGGYCDSCQKEVIDFTRKSDREIIQLLENSESSTCGYLRKSQLKTYSTSSVSNFRQNVSYFGARITSFFLLSILSISKSQAQEKETSPTIQIHLDKKINYLDSTSQTIVSEHEVSGILVDAHTGEPLPFANIMLKGSDIGTMTDIDGKFKFPQPLKVGDALVFAYIGYRPVQFNITEGTSPILNIVMKLDGSGIEMEFMGEVVLDQVYESKPSLWQKLKVKFK